MIDPESPIRLALVGNPKYSRYAVTLTRYPFLPTLYWSGAADDPWTADVSGAMRWADYGAAELAVREVEAAETDGSPGAG
jgi:hypothetical protein